MSRQACSVLVVLGVLGVLFVGAFAAPAEAGKERKPPPPPPPSTAAPTSTPPELKAVATDELMRRAQSLYAALDYDQVLPLVREVLSRNPGVDVALDAYVLEGSCLAIVGNPVDAEQPFRRLLRGRPSFDLPSDTPPKIMAVFRKVQVEENEIRKQMEELTRKRIVDAIVVQGDGPQRLKGGRPIAFSYRVVDPSGSVSGVRVQYKKRGDAAYSSLPLVAEAKGWHGQIPGEWSANDGGAVLEYVVETADNKGVLKRLGSEAQPLVADIAAGQVDRSSPPPLSPWVVWVGAGTTAALAATAVGLGTGMLLVQDDYQRLADESTRTPVQASVLKEKQGLGDGLAWAANGMYAASTLALLTTGVAAVFFTDWEGAPADDEGEPQTAASAAR